ncbi:Crp/Fnr family transcriptional regulator [Pedobacter heparinus]|uniref:Crp/Fnr family transcriptional regulator n=1 Tax=Pedobacter heparinus (strain ATCC 13125 / DSM 2366 / CIP 104194 / JCM 7457 / NBRC 12017 / NCIMB 9290 / NRRL B-14731 / HIM 762-3) TaxID=485917 RepID=C6Y3M2_PEDHD|nr:Crp/Fnr family transcriptional regulator [Pedobacter heparinus]ACU03301.1 hypothetical protein Phep_1083 [Pedobacter heparinus DSM 2366]
MKKLSKLTDQMIILWKQCVIDYLERLYGKPLKELAEALLMPGALTPRYRRKGYILQYQDMPVFEAHYLKSGLVKLYSIDAQSGAEKIFYIWEPDSVIVMYEEFRENLPSGDYFIELITDCELVSITNMCMEGIYEQHPAAHDLTHKITSQQKRRNWQQMNILLTPAKSNRFAMFEQRFPGLRGKLSNDEICSFIGIGVATLTNSKNE